MGVPAAARIAQVPGDEIAQAQSFIRLAHQDEAPSEVTRDPWKSTFSEALKGAETARFVSHSLGVDLQSIFMRLGPI